MFEYLSTCGVLMCADAGMRKPRHMLRAQRQLEWRSLPLFLFKRGVSCQLMLTPGWFAGEFLGTLLSPPPPHLEVPGLQVDAAMVSMGSRDSRTGSTYPRSHLPGPSFILHTVGSHCQVSLLLVLNLLFYIFSKKQCPHLFEATDVY